MISLMTLLRWHACWHPKRVALVCEGSTYSYGELYDKARQMASLLYAEHGVRPGMRVCILCRNHLTTVLLLVASSRLGADVRFLNTDMPAEKLQSLMHCSLLVYDEEVKTRCLPEVLPCKAISAEALSLQLQARSQSRVSLPYVCRVSSISVLTGGSSGKYKEASRSTGMWQFLSPFWALLHDVGIHRHSSVLIALPFYHGFGLATLIVSLLLGKKVCLLRHFDTMQVLDAIEQHRIEVLPVVPAMLSRIWQTKDAAMKMSSARCIISGGDRLERSVVDATLQNVGPILYNMYGTSEAGFMMLAKPEDLSMHADDITLGKPICGVRCEVRDVDADNVGTLWVRSAWAATGQKHRWQNTGDRVFRNEQGYFFHRGRADRIVVCGGENVSLDGVEQAICTHPAVADAWVSTAEDARFGQVLVAQVERKVAGQELTEETLLSWLKPRLSRAEMPHRITFGKIDLLSTGKRSISH